MSIALQNKVDEHERRLQALEKAFEESSKQFAQQVNDEMFGSVTQAPAKPTLKLPEKRKSA